MAPAIRHHALFQSTPSVWRETTPQDFFDKLDRISIHSLRVEGDVLRRETARRGGIFQSTPSVWRETMSTPSTGLVSSFQSTPSVWRETKFVYMHKNDRGFQSTPSVWRETATSISKPSGISISIHSLRVEGDT